MTFSFNLILPSNISAEVASGYRFSFGYKLPVLHNHVFSWHRQTVLIVDKRLCRRAEEIAVIQSNQAGPQGMAAFYNNIANIYFPLQPFYVNFGREVHFSDTDINFDL